MLENIDRTKIDPTVGRIVWVYAPSKWAGPRAGIVVSADVSARPHPTVNVRVFCDQETDGLVDVHCHRIPIVDPHQIDESAPDCPRRWAQWMPYQKGQAARTEQLERQLATAADELKRKPVE